MTAVDLPTGADADRAAYLEAVEEALAGLPELERQELLDDLADHLTELAAEDGPLADRLGPPDRYAAELVASAGIEVPAPPGPPVPPPPLTTRVTAATRRAWTSPTADAVRAFLPELRPGWWVLRGWAVLALLDIALDDGPVFPIPDPFDNGFVSLVLLGVVVVASVRLGRRGGGFDRALTWLGALGMVVALANGSNADQAYEPTVDPYGAYRGSLITPDGRTITNIWPVDADGDVVDVFLFDQEGMPIEVGDTGLTRGVALPGLYPQEQWVEEWDVHGNLQQHEAEPPHVSVPRVPAGDGSETSTTSSTSTTVAPATSTTAPATPPPGGAPGS
jgi:hypothetical protein